MQTFLPLPDFQKSAQCLDRMRLGKQRVEVLQLLNAIINGCAWSNHPAARMWSGHTNALVDYGVAICDEWISRGYRDTCREKILAYSHVMHTTEMPPWFGREDFHLSHQSNLVRKLPEHYRPLWPFVPNNLAYVWPDGGGK